MNPRCGLRASCVTPEEAQAETARVQAKLKDLKATHTALQVRTNIPAAWATALRSVQPDS